MSLFVIGDLHLSFTAQKPMDGFYGWQDHIKRLQSGWCDVVKAEDTVVLAGDTSWGMSLEQSRADFEFIDNLPGKKIILKGNHDYWWTSLKKMKDFFANCSFATLDIMHNNSFEVMGVSVCGTRGWMFERGEEKDQKLIARETGRLQASLKTATQHKKIVFLHYPPIYRQERSDTILQVMREYEVEHCFYGHLHGHTINHAYNDCHDGVNYKLISADALRFLPFKVL